MMASAGANVKEWLSNTIVPSLIFTARKYDHLYVFPEQLNWQRELSGRWKEKDSV
jgi:hypothetical protein